MLFAQSKYNGLRLWSLDTGQAYAKFSVKLALQEYKKTKSITMAMKRLVVISYGVIGFPDLVGIYMGIFIGIEIKVGKDRQSEDQKAMEATIKKAGGVYLIVKDGPIEPQLTPLDKVREWMTRE